MQIVAMPGKGFRSSDTRRRAACPRQRALFYGRHAAQGAAEHEPWLDPAQGAESNWYDAPTSDLGSAGQFLYPSDYDDRPF
jgi:hypothetical protein